MQISVEEGGEGFVLCPGEGKRLGWPGHTITIKVSGEETQGRVTVYESEIGPGEGASPHIHRREDEVWRILEGCFHIHVGGVDYTATPGTVIFLPRNTLHWYVNIGETNARFLAVATPAGIEEMFADITTAVTGKEGLERTAALIAAAAPHGIEFVLPDQVADKRTTDCARPHSMRR